ncbi:sulfatase family protein [Stieleria varia]|uniref:Arylsulfatase n=1 Tax=Stieleria varia TaxID=2528005 RepID=A0A5C5ZWK3_9BACT|nr:sulfatase [Stieleria varia]TWT91495.1 Arylsulfatase [Stieleria varia]
MKTQSLCLLSALVFLTLSSAIDTSFAETPPNVVWIIADDLGPELGCCGYPSVSTPNIDRLAANGTLFTHAFSTAPVCSSSRTAFQTGRYQIEINAQHHNTRDKQPLPESVPTVTGLMRQAGYFVSNGHGLANDKKVAKSHFNFVYDSKEFFDGNDWSQRQPEQPFFAQIQIKEPHRPFVKSDRIHSDAPIPPYYPEHPITRADWSDYLASIEELDRKVGRVLDRLEAEGLRENTLVLFFGDHGRPHVRGKQWLYDGGLHTPLIVSWPGKIAAGKSDDRLTSLLDLMPTTLAAAGISQPGLPGLSLLSSVGHEKLFAARDRCGDAVDRIRCVRTRDFKYIRNYYPDRPYLQLSSYKKLSYPVVTLMKVLHEQGKWDAPFMAETRPAEELYDLNADPNEMHNLAGEERHQATLARLRQELDRWIDQTGDTGAIDESKTVDMVALMKEKTAYYEKAMKQRGLNPAISDDDYLQWWAVELGISSGANGR